MKSFPLPARPVGSAVPANHDEFSDGFSIEGKLNGWRGWFDQETKQGYNRHGKFASNHSLMADMILGAGIKSRFVDCEIMGQRTKTGKGKSLWHSRLVGDVLRIDYCLCIASICPKVFEFLNSFFPSQFGCFHTPTLSHFPKLSTLFLCYFDDCL